MSWSELLKREVEYTYKVTENLLGLVDDDKLDWKPSAENNWMTTGQLLKHITESCGVAMKGFVTGDWGMPEDFDPSQMKPEDMLPPAEKLPTLGSVAEAKKLLAEDKTVAMEMLAKCTEEELATKPAPAPWDSAQMILGHRLLQMVDHLKSHKGQLFYYLKLQGKPVDTNSLWGM
ncbi:MAG: DinB family protein [Candidatus Latescibacterota bacterium]|nr:MAG: DinB family protein [Candidatus Latescibacterota bacterium]